SFVDACTVARAEMQFVAAGCCTAATQQSDYGQPCECEDGISRRRAAPEVPPRDVTPSGSHPLPDSGSGVRFQASIVAMRPPGRTRPDAHIEQRPEHPDLSLG